jgi:hypothetical protein
MEVSYPIYIKENINPDGEVVAETIKSVTIPKSVLLVLSESQAGAIEFQQRTIENLFLSGKQDTAGDVITARASG